MERVNGRAPARGFVVMPFGRKKNAQGEEIDFDLVYRELIEPAMLAAGVEPRRADQEMRAGGIHGDMFQDLLLADLVVADLTIDNPNAYYELGVRHALRDNATVSIFSSERPFLPFDVVGERSLLYAPIRAPVDQTVVEADRAKLTQMIGATLAAWRGRKTSPVYRFLPNLEEPAWKNLKVGDITEVWERLESWQALVATAVSKQRPADILLLADETPNRFLELEAIQTAVQALLKLDSVKFALAIIERGLALDPDNLWLQQQYGIALGRAGRFHDARARLSELAERHRTGETLSLLGLTYKDHWLRLWSKAGTPPAARRQKATAAAAFLEMAIDAYAKGFRASPYDSYPGINTLTLGRLWENLTGRTSRVDLDLITQGVRWTVDCILQRCNADLRHDYWAFATRGELRLVADGDGGGALEDFAAAAAQGVVDSNRAALQSTRQQLDILLDLNFRAELVQPARALIAEAETQLSVLQGARLERPKRIVLFSGHMIDNPKERGEGEGKKPARFPATKVAAAAAAIAAHLDSIKAGPGDLALCGGACGGDLLFAEACLQRGMALEMRLPQRIPQFLHDSVTFADSDQSWVQRFDAAMHNPQTTLLIMPDEIGPTPEGERGKMYDRNNRWQLYSALSLDLDTLKFITLLDRQSIEKPGGAQHMIRRIREYTGREPLVIDPTAL
ncbi:tetratricopeptide repeat protein [Defluviicoccus vanus]|uniref:Tetratricopeptide repeat protein n=1 Tax=Defluviicoccus vanus TaxID=111831 RepID=A0A7H1N5P2_9PROT|nr:tetratricopeptide repeat-containing protein [Defluviicoccus vanus]QNT71028.1 tetratricopeptide repeat protein [Defluviicoccus vanus]